MIPYGSRRRRLPLPTIRKLDGFRYFLEPNLSELQAQAADGLIVMVNLTDISSDAVIVTPNGADAIQLPKARTALAPSFLKPVCTRLGAARMAWASKRDVEKVDGDDGISDEELAWLWHGCVKPVVTHPREKNTLGQGGSHDGLARVWWLGSGVATSLPFHAARSIVPSTK